MSQDKDKERSSRERIERLEQRLIAAMPMQTRDTSHLAAVLRGVLDLLKDEL